MTKRLSPAEKKNRKPTSRACVFCHKKHLQCSNERPCKNCVKRNLGDQCRDVVRKRAKYLHSGSKDKEAKQEMGDDMNIEGSGTLLERESIKGDVSLGMDLNTFNNVEIIPPQNQICTEIKDESIGQFTDTGETLPTFGDVNSFVGKFEEPKVNPAENVMLNTTNDVINKLLYNESLNAEAMYLSDSLSQDTSVNNDKIENAFNSNYLNQEYLMLGDILLKSRPTSPSPSSTSISDYHEVTVSPANTVIPGMELVGRLTNLPAHKENKLKDSRPFIALGFLNQDEMKENNSETHLGSGDKIPYRGIPAKNEPFIEKGTEYSSPLITQNIYKSVQDIYSGPVTNFDYPQSYHLLTNFLKRRFLGNYLSQDERKAKRNNLLIILKLIASYRPTFISAHKNLLKPYDLLFLEMSFQRSLIDCKTLLRLNSSPTIIWRRTGEIVFISDELVSILGLKGSDILSQRTFIMELMYDDESIINYFKLFKSIAVGNLHLSIITKCKLSRNSDSNLRVEEILSGLANKKYIEFSSVWTVKRDLFDLPMLIVGQFLPILLGGEGVRKY